jgi:hypothetical protein
MKTSRFVVVLASLATGSLFSCGDDSSDDHETVACQLDAFNQCVEWIDLSGAQVDSLRSTCVDDDGGEVVDACPTENMVGTCKEGGDGPEPDARNHFYLPPGQDPVTYAATKEQACTDAGGVWVPA